MPVRIDSIRLTYGHVFAGGTFLVVNWYRRVYPAMSGTLHKQVGLGCIRKGTEQVVGGKLISRTLLGSLLQFLPSGSCFDFCPSFSWWWTLTCKPKESSQAVSDWCFITAAEKQTRAEVSARSGVVSMTALTMVFTEVIVGDLALCTGKASHCSQVNELLCGNAEDKNTKGRRKPKPENGGLACHVSVWETLKDLS